MSKDGSLPSRPRRFRIRCLPPLPTSGALSWLLRRLFAQHPFQDLSGRALGQFLDELDAAWSLVDGEVAATVLDARPSKMSAGRSGQKVRPRTTLRLTFISGALHGLSV